MTTEADLSLADALKEAVTQTNYGKKPNGKDTAPVDVGAENIAHATTLCAQALADIYEECAKRFETAIEAENKLHEDTIGRLKANAQACRECGAATAEWLKGRGATANQVASNALASSKALQAVLPQ